MFGFKEMSNVVKEFGNAAAGISGAYETPAKPMKTATTLTGKKAKKKTDWDDMLKKQHLRRGDK